MQLPPTEPLLAADNFNGLEDITHLCSGGESPWLSSHQLVFEEFSLNKSKGFDGREAVLEQIELCRKLTGELWHVPSSRISFAPSSADAMANLAHGLAWRAGDNIVTTALEFPSVGWAWRALQDIGVEIRRVPHRDWLVHEQDLINATDDRTRVVSVSQVSFYTGQQLDIAALHRGLSTGTALLAVDATHASGAVKVDASLADICMSSSYKWMLATTGVAPLFISERAEQQMQATTFGWRNLEVFDDDYATTPAQQSNIRAMPYRYEAGNPAQLPILTLRNGLQTILKNGIDNIDNHVRCLSEQVSVVLKELGLNDISPSALHQRSGNTCFRDPQAQSTMEKLAKLGVLVWGGEGRVRISTHLFNSSDDVSELRVALSKIRR